MTAGSTLRFRIALPLVFIVLALISSQATADDFDRPGAYIGVNGVYAISLFQNDINELAGLDDDFNLGDSPGVNARLGYRIFSWFAVEAEYEWVQSMDLKVLDLDIGDFKPNTVTANLKFILPVWRIQPYLLMGGGVAIWDIDSPIQNQSSTGFAGRVGLGIDTYLTKHWVFNLEATGVLNTNDIDPSKISNDITDISHL
jgi:opacity protein-like surface antigen